MTQHHTIDFRAALLSLVCPGLGQLEQGRRRLGWMLLAWSIVGLVALFLAPPFGYSRAVPGIELLVLAAWSVWDAARGAPAP